MDGQKPDETTTPAQFAPGDTIRPQQDAPAPTTPQATAPAEPVQSAPAAPTPQPVEPAVATPPPAAPSVPAQQSEPAANLPENPEYSELGDDAITWTASEFIAHHKTSGWYALLLLAAAAGAVLIWVLTKDVVSAGAVVFAAIILASYAARQPRQLSYQLDDSGLTIGEKHYSYSEFRSFSVMQEGAFSSIVFSPLKRFGTLVTIYYDPQDEDRILQALTQRLPHEERRPDPIDSMMRRIRF